MSYRKWMKKWQPVIFWAVAFSFVAGVIWWSVATYLSGRRSSQEKAYSVSDATAYLTKDGSPLNNEEYWVMPWDLNESYTNIISAYGITNVDPIFDEPQYKSIVLDSMLKEKVQIYYANENNLKPTKEEIREKLKEIEKQVKENENALDYIKRRYKSLSAYLENIKPNVEKALILDKVKKSVASVSEEDMRKYFQEHTEDIRNKYEKVDASILSFSNESSASTFIEKAKKEGFEKAATDLGLNPTDLPNITHNIFTEDVEKVLFSASKGDIVGPLKIGETWFVFKIKDVVKIESFDDFLASEYYESEKERLSNERFQKWFDDFMKEERLGYGINDEVLKYWFEYVRNPKDPDTVLKIERELEKKIFEGEKIKEDSPDELKALYVLTLEFDRATLKDEIDDYKDYIDILKSATKTEQEEEKLKELKGKYGEKSQEELEKTLEELQSKYDELGELRKTVVEYLYKEYPTSLEVLARMAELFPDDPKVNFEYFDSLYNMIKPAIQSGYIYQDRNLIFRLLQIQAGLYKVAYDASASTDMRTEAFYDVYEINKLLKDATSASITLSEMRKIAPDFLDYESEFLELEDMLKSSTPSER